MANRPAPALSLPADDRERLLAMTRSPSLPAGVAQRARILLLAADGLANAAIADKVGVSRPTVLHWRQRYAEGGLAGLADLDRPGRRPRVAAADVLAATLLAPPRRLGVNHWSSRLLGGELGVDRGSVMRAWHGYGLQPVRGGFRFAATPVLTGRVAAVLAVRLGAPESFAVLDVREPTLVTEREAIRPVVHTEALAELAAALRQGAAVRADDPSHELLAFLDRLQRARLAWPTSSRLHLVADGRGPLGLPAFREALAARSRITVHVARDPGCWPEMLFGWVAMAARGVDGPTALPALDRRRQTLRPGEVFTWAYAEQPAPTVR
jgi:transposase